MGTRSARAFNKFYKLGLMLSLDSIPTLIRSPIIRDKAKKSTISLKISSYLVGVK